VGNVTRLATVLRAHKPAKYTANLKPQTLHELTD